MTPSSWDVTSNPQNSLGAFSLSHAFHYHPSLKPHRLYTPMWTELCWSPKPSVIVLSDSLEEVVDIKQIQGPSLTVTMWGHSENVCKPEARRRGLLLEPGQAGTLLSDFQPPELWQSTFWLFKSPSLWYLVMAAGMDQDTGPRGSQSIFLLCIDPNSTSHMDFWRRSSLLL